MAGYEGMAKKMMQNRMDLAEKNGTFGNNSGYQQFTGMAQPPQQGGSLGASQGQPGNMGSQELMQFLSMFQGGQKPRGRL